MTKHTSVFLPRFPLCFVSLTAQAHTGEASVPHSCNHKGPSLPKPCAHFKRAIDDTCSTAHDQHVISSVALVVPLRPKQRWLFLCATATKEDIDTHQTIEFGVKSNAKRWLGRDEMLLTKASHHEFRLSRWEPVRITLHLSIAAICTPHGKPTTRKTVHIHANNIISGRFECTGPKFMASYLSIKWIIKNLNEGI